MAFSTSGSKWSPLDDYQSEYQVKAWVPFAGPSQNNIEGQTSDVSAVPELSLTEPEFDVSEHHYVGDVASCSHPYGRLHCPSHNTHDISACHSELGAYSTADFSHGNSHLAGRANDYHRSASLPPSLERYVQDPQHHEKISTGHGIKCVKKSKRYHKSKARKNIATKDMKVVDRRDEYQQQSSADGRSGRSRHGS
ncbi:uncharacterized protein JN550_005094 [Neoarthrinium moseri]|uniref:uncharacterized protein n=1 Tax=Neoarthrinium moseri TaxID=1658444 RepID=UPI001FDD9848|nr:uncharacterized protein JN550_005094 [Neoarthrinium moseri]KAI1870551.1 hypothetical protein JN550_005094 [Neoarthrinium moseri]